MVHQKIQNFLVQIQEMGTSLHRAGKGGSRHKELYVRRSSTDLKYPRGMLMVGYIAHKTRQQLDILRISVALEY